MLDGRALHQCIPWVKGVIFKQLCSVYTEYVIKQYENAIAVFDGYQGISCSIVCGIVKGLAVSTQSQMKSMLIMMLLTLMNFVNL